MTVNEKIFYRQICEKDKQDLKELHEELFPIRYLDSFYEDAVRSKGLHGRDMFTSIAVLHEESGHEKLIGFVLAQLIATDSCEDSGMFGGKEPQEVLYILTIGLRKEFRRGGHGRRLVDKCVEYACTTPSCGAVYLHVIHYNSSAIQFYEKIGFEFIMELSQFYNIDSVFHSSYLYAIYINGYCAPLRVRYWNNSRRSIARWWAWCCTARPLMQTVCRVLGQFGLQLDCPVCLLSICYFKKMHPKALPVSSETNVESALSIAEEDRILKVL